MNIDNTLPDWERKLLADQASDAAMGEIVFDHHPQYGGADSQVCRSCRCEWDPSHVGERLRLAGYGKLPKPPAWECSFCSYPTDEADGKFWQCPLCGCEDYEMRDGGTP